jgi:hypothetical protein
MDNDSKPEIPSIVTEDLSSTPVIHVNDHEASFPPAPCISSSRHSREPGDPFLLSHGLPMSGRQSIDTTTDEDGLGALPPSPTLFTQSSVHFTTSTALQEIKPGDGSSSLALLSPTNPSHSHPRRPSNATITSTDEGIVANHIPGISHLYLATSSTSDIPSIVTEDLSSTPVIHVNDHEEPLPSAPRISSSSHSRKSSDPFLLSPGLPISGRQSIDTTADEDGLGVIPPSPILSTQSSVHFTTSTALRENKPGDGSSSLALLSPTNPSRSHSRRPSNATITSTEEGTVADHAPGVSHLYQATSNTTTSARSTVETLNSPIPTHIGPSPDTGEFKTRIPAHPKPRKKVGSGDQGLAEGGDNKDDGDKTIQPDLAQDTHIDPTPFSFRPFHLASLVDPKNLKVLETIFGLIDLSDVVVVNASSFVPTSILSLLPWNYFLIMPP